MPTLHNGAPETLAAGQRQFSRALLDCDEGIPGTLDNSRRERARRGFNVHRNNVCASLPECVLAKYPIVQKIAGRDFATAAARIFVERHPPKCPVLLWYGGLFPEFLAAFEPARTVPYLADIARLEWAIAEAQNAADAPTISGDVLAAMPLEAAGQTTIALHPSLRMTPSAHPIFTIWMANTRDERSSERLKIKATAEIALVVRPRFEVRVLRIDRGVEAFVSALARRQSIDQATNLAADIFPAFDLAGALITLFSSGAVSGIRSPDQAASP